MKAFGAALLALFSAAAGSAATMYIIRKREELEQYDYDFDDDELYFEDEDDIPDLSLDVDGGDDITPSGSGSIQRGASTFDD